MTSIYHLNSLRPPFLEHPANYLENHSVHIPGPHHSPGRRHHNHDSPPFWGWGSRKKHGVRGHHGRHGRYGRPIHYQEGQPQQNEETEASGTVEKNAEAAPSSSTLIPEGQETANDSSSSDSDEHRHGRKHKHKGRHMHGAGKDGRTGEGCKGHRGHGSGRKNGHGDKFGGHGGHPFGHAHALDVGFGGPFHAKGHLKGRRGRGHFPGRGMWHDGMFHESKRLHHAAMKSHHELMQQHHAMMQAHREPMWDSQDGSGHPFTGRGDVFIPRIDIFETSARYIVHISLAGAKKSDLSTHYDAAESALRVTGTIIRPGMNEELYRALVLEERSVEIGAFERVIRLGTRQAPASVLVDGIVAVFEDGVLAFTIPKSEESDASKIPLADCDSFDEMNCQPTDVNDMGLDEPEERVATPDSGESESEGEYVRICVQ